MYVGVNGMRNIMSRCLIFIWISCTLFPCCVLSQGNVVEDISPRADVFQSNSLPTDRLTGVVNRRYMPGMANGHLATNVYTDTIYVNGLYTGYRGWSYRARIQSYHACQLEIPEDVNATHLYSLDVSRGVFEETISSNIVNVTYRTYAHRYYNRILVTEVTLDRVLGSGNTNEINVTVTSLSGNATSDIVFDVNPVACAINKTCMYVGGSVAEAETETSGRTPIHIYWSEMPPVLTLPAGQANASWIFLLSVDQNNSVASAHFEAASQLISAGRKEELLLNHTSSWAEIWSEGRIDIEGDLRLRKVVNGAMFYLYSNLPSRFTYSPTNQFYGLSPGGLATGKNGSDYYGHVFWDMETWMYPVMLLFRPHLAKEMLSYRINGILPAMERASLGGYSGARFPWESGYTGVEVTPDICVKCRENQQHITGDIAFAARQYVSATRDVEWLTMRQLAHNFTGFQFIHEMARFWYTRPTFNLTKDRYEINKVMAPDEHAEEVNNSICTNVVASLSIHFARYAACLAGQDPFAAVPDRWINVAQQLFFPYHSEKRYHEEFEGYDYLKVTNQSDPRGVKQADVVLLGYPFLFSMPVDVRRNDLMEYEPVTHPQGPAMTWGMYSTAYMELGDKPNASRLFFKSYDAYVREPFKIWTEVILDLGAVNFLTGMGGFLQALVSGFGGLRLHVEELSFYPPQLPPGATRVSFRNLDYLGTEFDLYVFDGQFGINVTRDNWSMFPLVLHYATDERPARNLTAGTYFESSSQAFRIYTTAPSNCPLPSDFINVDYTNPTSPPVGAATVASATSFLMAATSTFLLFMNLH